MKKAVYLFLISLFSLVGCNKNTKQVKYSSISEEDFIAYFTDEAKASALENFSTISKIRFTNYQDVKYDGGFMKYTLNRDLDENYFYEYAKMEDGSGVSIAHSLYIGDNDIEKCNYYEVNAHESTVKTGSEAVSSYEESAANVRNMVSHVIDNYLFITKQYIQLDDITSSKYYQGDDNSIKVVSYCVKEDRNDSATTIIDKDTLLIKSARCDFNNAEGKGYVKMNFKYDVSFSHKTPKDIGYKEN